MIRLSTVRTSVLVAMAAALVATVALTSAATASVPTGTPVFTNPLTVTNTFFPFQDGAMKVFKGVKEGKASVVVDLYLSDTRTFSFSGQNVQTHILQETEFLGGVIEEISLNYFAQADDGTVYYFGEVVNTFEDGVVTGHEGSWLVGGPTLPTDPADAGNAPAPTVFMPANPEEGDVFKQEDLFPIVDETDTVQRVDLTIHVTAGRLTNVMQLLETSEIEGTLPETKWYAANVGVIKAKGRGESLQLIASTLTQ